MNLLGGRAGRCRVAEPAPPLTRARGTSAVNTQLLLLALLASQLGSGAAQAVNLTLSPASGRGPPTPLWGCENPALPPGDMHVVVSTYNADPEQLLPWLWHLGLTSAAVYIYHRLEDHATAVKGFEGVVLPCNMSLHILPVLPNKGREAAVFLTHLVRHYDDLPLAVLLAHDHGPASRHSLCGPFYRRSRAYYRGLRLLRDRWRQRQERISRGQKVSNRGRRGDQTKEDLLVQFASMVVTLNSGCSEEWSRGCCASFVCARTRAPFCPFAASVGNCMAPELDRRAAVQPVVGRHFWLNERGLYDPRSENQVVGPDGTMYPFAMVRYIGGAHRSTEMWNITHEYPPDVVRRSKQETLDIMKQILESYGPLPEPGSMFKSCCAALMMQRKHVRRWPVQLYKDLLNYSMDPFMHYEATKAVSIPAWGLWSDRNYTASDILNYMRVDLLLGHIRGCPAQRSEGLPRLGERLRSALRADAEWEGYGAEGEAEGEGGGEGFGAEGDGAGEGEGMSGFESWTTAGGASGAGTSGAG
ncbi:hypothetical protein HYH03_013388 [Edaphochlamys debaryana]|uniref:Uncharacterized protein n=1 Tax=Edaphochlamys debaryana TaxID=47281 RepID=A0A835XR25_9CHLO|nr:hypothetical protein HYH03_013388 [Edaphochlamys debaryana]|eukprot:KAG2488085.1 hypothetical protein HYH03_013388 [Edaphochlamys debaryana]